MKIAYLGIKGLPSHSGAERVVEAVATRLAGRHQITVYCSSRYTPAKASIPGLRLIRVPCLGGKYSHMISVDFLAALHAILRGDYDLVHLHNLEAAFVLPLLWLRYPVVSTLHGFPYLVSKWSSLAKQATRWMEIPFTKLSNRITSVSSREAGEFHERYHRAVDYIPNGVSTELAPNLVAARAILEQHTLEPGKYLLFVAGRIEPTKGAHLAIQAVNRLKGDFSLLVVGDDTQVPGYSLQLKELAGSRVRFQPFVESSEVLSSLMAHSAGLVFPSMVEAMSMVLLEAASLGVPIVCADIPANRAVLPEQALYFTSGEAEDLAARLEWALGHSSEMKALGAQAQAWVRAHFDWDGIAEQYDRLYREVVGEG